MKITKFNKEICNKLGKEIENSLKSIGKKYGLEIKEGSGKYTELIFDMKLNISIGSREEIENKKYVSDWNRFIGDKTNLHLGQQFTFKNKIYKILGYHWGSKFNVATQNPKGEVTYFRFALLDDAAKGAKEKEHFIIQ